MQLNLKFRERWTQIGAWAATEFDHLLAAISGSWLVEHTEEDGHANITGYSLTLSKDTQAGTTGTVTAAGDGIFAGEVSAEADAIRLWSAQRPGSTTPGDHKPVIKHNDWYLYADDLVAGDTRFEWVNPAFVDGLSPPQNIAAWLRINGGNVEFTLAPASNNGTMRAGAYLGGVVSTWTPNLLFGGTNAGMTYGTQAGWVMQFGSLTWVSVDIALTNKGGDMGAATITGMPFAASASIIPLGLLQPVANMNGLTAPHVSVVTTSILLLDVAASNDVQLNDTNFANNSHIRVTAVYMA